jgi:hypothetical protein
MAVLTQKVVWRAANISTRSLDLTLDQQAHVRKALRFLQVRAGGLKELAASLGIAHKTLGNVISTRTVTASVALRAARIACIPLEELIEGRWPKEGTCPHCGRE